MPGTTEPRSAGLLSSKRLVADLLAPRPAIYWTDFLLSASAGWTAFGLAATLPWNGPGVLALPVAVLALYRAALFIHELTHLKSGALPGFSLAWNLLLGIPMLVPSYLYVGVHNDHHRRTSYGTPLDPEYRPLARGSRAGVLLFLAEPLVAPLLLFLRHLVFAPASWLIPPLRRFIERRASGLVINPLYIRRALAPGDRRRMVALEAGCLLVWAALFYGIHREIVPAGVPLVWYLVASLVLLVNQVRTLGAHLYRNDGQTMDLVDQILDSVSVEGRWWTELWAPVGLRYHALHHYLPDLPYHALGAAHRRLMAALPADAPYRRAVRPGLAPVLRGLWNSPLRDGTP